MNIKFALDRIEEIICNLEKKETEESVESYSAIIAIIMRLDEKAKDEAVPIANYREYRTKFLWSCESICGLDDGNGHDKSQHLRWALAAINNLKSGHCFNVK